MMKASREEFEEIPINEDRLLSCLRNKTGIGVTDENYSSIQF